MIYQLNLMKNSPLLLKNLEQVPTSFCESSSANGERVSDVFHIFVFYNVIYAKFLRLQIFLYVFMIINFFSTVCASRPWLILFLGFLLIIGLGHGIKYIQVTTDPVELWASPHSRSRVEREYFDEHFEPFYRNEQIIITSVGLPKVCTIKIISLSLHEMILRNQIMSH